MPEKDDGESRRGGLTPDEAAARISRLVWAWIKERWLKRDPPPGVTWEQLAAWCIGELHKRYLGREQAVLEHPVIAKVMEWAYDAASIVLGLMCNSRPLTAREQVEQAKNFERLVDIAERICLRCGFSVVRADAKAIAAAAVIEVVTEIRAGKYNIKSSLTTWMNVIVSRVAIRHLRHEVQRAMREYVEADVSAGSEEDDPKSLDELNPPDYAPGSTRELVEALLPLIPGLEELQEWARAWAPRRFRRPPEYGEDHLWLCMKVVKRKDVEKRWGLDPSTVHRHQERFRQDLAYYISTGQDWDAADAKGGRPGKGGEGAHGSSEKAKRREDGRGGRRLRRGR